MWCSVIGCWSDVSCLVIWTHYGRQHSVSQLDAVSLFTNVCVIHYIKWRASDHFSSVVGLLLTLGI
jgi:hypothetical protein